MEVSPRQRELESKMWYFCRETGESGPVLVGAVLNRRVRSTDEFMKHENKPSNSKTVLHVDISKQRLMGK